MRGSAAGHWWFGGGGCCSGCWKFRIKARAVLKYFQIIFFSKFRNNLNECSQCSSLCWHHHSNLHRPICNCQYSDYHHSSYHPTIQMVYILCTHNPTRVIKKYVVYMKIKLKKVSYCAVSIPSLGIIEATSSTIPVAIGIVVFIITPHIIGPARGSTAICRWGCSGWWCSCCWRWGGCWTGWSSSTLYN